MPHVLATEGSDVPTLSRQAFVCGLQLLETVFPSLKHTKDVITSYYQLFQDLSDDEYLAAVSSVATRQEQLYPNTNLVALIRRAAEGSLDERAQHALIVARRAIDRFGDCRSLQFDDPIITDVLQTMGGLTRALVTETDYPTWCAEFRHLYKHHHRCPNPSPPQYVPGSSEIENAKRGYPVLPPTRVDRHGQIDDSSPLSIDQVYRPVQLLPPPVPESHPGHSGPLLTELTPYLPDRSEERDSLDGEETTEADTDLHVEHTAESHDQLNE